MQLGQSSIATQSATDASRTATDAAMIESYAAKYISRTPEAGGRSGFSSGLLGGYY